MADVTMVYEFVMLPLRARGVEGVAQEAHAVASRIFGATPFTLTVEIRGREGQTISEMTATATATVTV